MHNGESIGDIPFDLIEPLIRVCFWSIARSIPHSSDPLYVSHVPGAAQSCFAHSYIFQITLNAWAQYNPNTYGGEGNRGNPTVRGPHDMTYPEGRSRSSHPEDGTTRGRALHGGMWRVGMHRGELG